MGTLEEPTHGAAPPPQQLPPSTSPPTSPAQPSSSAAPRQPAEPARPPAPPPTSNPAGEAHTPLMQELPHPSTRPPPAPSDLLADPPTATRSDPPPLEGEELNLELLLMSGRRRRTRVAEGETVGEVLERVWREWPDDWGTSDPRPASPDDLRLLYLGRFLKPASTLSDAGLQPLSSAEDGTSARTIVHLHVRTLRPPEDADLVKPDAEGSCCPCCVVS